LARPVYGATAFQILSVVYTAAHFPLVFDRRRRRRRRRRTRGVTPPTCHARTADRPRFFDYNNIMVPVRPVRNRMSNTTTTDKIYNNIVCGYVILYDARDGS